MTGREDRAVGLRAVGLGDVYRARARIAPYVRRTPLVRADALSKAAGAEVRLKLECLQDIGAFKQRGAMNAILALDPEARARGVVTMSTGNHGRAVAWAAARLGVRAVVCLSSLVPSRKVEAIRAAGGEVRVVGRGQDEAGEEAMRLVREDGLALIPPFDDPAVIAGQGTIGIELLEDFPEIDTALIPLSGGGLFVGIAGVLKAADPSIRTVGISMKRGAAMAASLEAGRPVAVEEVETLADSLGGGIGLDNRHTFARTAELIDEMVLLEEEEIAAGMRHLHQEEGLVTEGAAAVGAAALLAGKVRAEGRSVATIVSGRNVNMDSFAATIAV